MGALTALAVSYFRTRGQNLATKHDFDELQRQLRATTEAVETIKSEVSQRDWARREWTNLRRQKLEALLDKMHECEADLDRRRNAAVEGSYFQSERDLIGELDTLSTLYAPELSKEVHEFFLAFNQERFAFLELGKDIAKAGNDIATWTGFTRPSAANGIPAHAFVPAMHYVMAPTPCWCGSWAWTKAPRRATRHEANGAPEPAPKRQRRPR